jgi:hypothetical protein
MATPLPEPNLRNTPPDHIVEVLRKPFAISPGTNPSSTTAQLLYPLTVCPSMVTQFRMMRV